VSELKRIVVACWVRNQWYVYSAVQYLTDDGAGRRNSQIALELVLRIPSIKLC